ncbi:hypothetical protein [uncultured Tyzzerella sp.]|uniref:hypothetical protein n=1 Tax=uncultured Tyzzerella sp. TaxID=2321398 RepID=UPI002942955B|nr:hypothetical protein [uncultured Tyzzerella sp.]
MDNVFSKIEEFFSKNLDKILKFIDNTSEEKLIIIFIFLLIFTVIIIFYLLNKKDKTIEILNKNLEEKNAIIAGLNLCIKDLNDKLSKEKV